MEKRNWEGLKNSVGMRHSGSLHHAVNMFLDKQQAEATYKRTDDLGKVTTITSPRGGLPFPIRNYTIYQSWITRPAAVKMLFTHATSICPRDDISVWEINTAYTWMDEELQYGTFNHKRDAILKDVEDGRLHIIVGGHSHRSLVMKVSKDHTTLARTIAAGETVNTDFMEPANIAMVTSSGGPFPKYIPGGPLICNCENNKNKYSTGFYYDKSKKKLYSVDDHTKTPIDSNACQDCTMKGEDMAPKPFRRHTPCGNLLIFENGKVRIKSVVAEHNTTDPQNMPTKPRKAVICEEHGVFVEDMRLEDIDSYEEFHDWDNEKPINIISRKPFTYYGYMEFPISAQYVTFLKGVLPNSENSVDLIDAGEQFKKRVRQKISKDSFSTLKRAAGDKSNFAFIRYSFGTSDDIWDREINISHNYNTGSASASVENDSAATYDEYKGMILEFRTIPDFKKRKDSDVCGY